MDMLDRFSLQHPIIQAGMADISRSKLATAVSLAGGLGTIGLSPPDQFELDIQDTIAQLEGKSYSVNLLMPFVLKDHIAICIRNKVPIVTLFFGLDPSLINTLKDNGTAIIMQVGSLQEAEQAMVYRVDGLIVQGTEAGGHVRGEETLAHLLPIVRCAFPNVPVMAAGGVHDKTSANGAYSLGADGVVCGTRFLMSHESFAHAEYKRRLMKAKHTVLTNLFGFSWPDKHRVIPNAATARWADHGKIGPWLRLLHRNSWFLAKSRAERRHIVARQSLRVPLYTPSPLKSGMEEELADVTALYAGECVSQIDQIERAKTIVDSIAIGSN